MGSVSGRGSKYEYSLAVRTLVLGWALHIENQSLRERIFAEGKQMDCTEVHYQAQCTFNAHSQNHTYIHHGSGVKKRIITPVKTIAAQAMGKNYDLTCSVTMFIFMQTVGMCLDVSVSKTSYWGLFKAETRLRRRRSLNAPRRKSIFRKPQTSPGERCNT